MIKTTYLVVSVFFNEATYPSVNLLLIGRQPSSSQINKTDIYSMCISHYKAHHYCTHEFNFCNKITHSQSLLYSISISSWLWYIIIKWLKIATTLLLKSSQWSMVTRKRLVVYVIIIRKWRGEIKWLNLSLALCIRIVLYFPVIYFTLTEL